MDPHQTMRDFAAMLDEAGLPPFAAALHDLMGDELLLEWPNGLTICVDLEAKELEPLDEDDRAAILGEPCSCGFPPIDVYVPGSPDDPRNDEDPPGIRVHRGPPLHPDDTAVVDGIPVTSPSRTLIDCAEFLSPDDLRFAFHCAREQGLLDAEALIAARGRVDWRPSLALFDEVMAEFIE